MSDLPDKDPHIADLEESGDASIPTEDDGEQPAEAPPPEVSDKVEDA